MGSRIVFLPFFGPGVGGERKRFKDVVEIIHVP